MDRYYDRYLAKAENRNKFTNKNTDKTKMLLYHNDFIKMDFAVIRHSKFVYY